MTTADPFAPEPLTDFDRDGRGAPKILPPGELGAGLISDRRRVTYQRTSTFSNHLEDKSGIHKWEMAHAVLGVAKSDDLIDMLRPLNYDDHKRDIAEHIAAAQEVAKLHLKANYGTAVHSYLEPGADPFALPRDPEMRRDVEAAKALRDSLGASVLGTEVRVVNDRVGVAGTFDGLWDIPGLGVVMEDWKTGKFSPLSWAVQLALYQEAMLYDVAEAEGCDPRSPIASLAGGRAPRRDIAIVMHAPRREAAPVPVPVDLELGRQLVAIGMAVREARSAAFQRTLVVRWSPGEVLEEPLDEVAEIVETETLVPLSRGIEQNDSNDTQAAEVPDVIQLIQKCSTTRQLLDLWELVKALGEGSEAISQACKARNAVLRSKLAVA